MRNLPFLAISCILLSEPLRDHSSDQQRSTVAASQTGGMTVYLSRESSTSFLVKIENRSRTPIVISDLPTHVVIYHQSKGGSPIPITWDGRNADMKPFGPFSTISLAPGSSYTVRRSVWMDPQHKIDRSHLLNKEGSMFAQFNPITPGQLEMPFRRQYAKVPFMKRALRSGMLILKQK